MWEAHLRFPPDAFPFFRANSRFVIRNRSERQSQREAWAEPVRRRDPPSGSFYSVHALSETFEFVADFPPRFQIGGLGCSRWSGVYPQPAYWSIWSELDTASRASCGVDFDVLGAGVVGH